MSNEKKASSEKELKQEKLLSELGEVTTRIDGIRRNQMIVSVIGILVIVGILVNFLMSLNSFKNNYDTQKLMKEISANSSIITQSPELKGLIADVQTTFIPTFKKSLKDAMEAEMPKLRKDAMDAASDIGTFIKTDVHARFTKHIQKSLKSIEQKLEKNHPGISSVELEGALKKANAHFIENITTILNRRVGEAQEKLAVLNSNLRKLEDTPEYAVLKEQKRHRTETALVEHFLELWIYHLNPDRGLEPAKGGN